MAAQVNWDQENRENEYPTPISVDPENNFHKGITQVLDKSISQVFSQVFGSVIEPKPKENQEASIESIYSTNVVISIDPIAADPVIPN